MDLEGQILHYCSNLIKKYLLIFSLFLLLFFSCFVYFYKFKTINFSTKIIEVNKGTDLRKISSQILDNSNFIEINMYYLFLKFWNDKIDKINYGEFEFQTKSNLIEITKILSKPSNVYHQITIVDGWQEYQLNNLFNKLFNIKTNVNYNDILADTYNYQSNDSLDEIISLMKNNKISYFKKNINNELFKKYSINEIMIIASLVEKEGINDVDKQIISSVIFNRLNKKMKLQIDASTIFSITKGKFKFDNKLTYNDLKIKDNFNTYYINGLPPTPLCYVSRKSIDIVLKNYKSNYLFYFYDKKLNQHIYSETFEQHSQKLKEYKKK